ncbi:hypothetical protein [Azospirillum palustre]
MRIRSRIAVVGGVPVMVAAVIAVAGGLLLARSERVYESAVLAGSVYRDVLAATAARIDYLQVAPADRASRADRFESMSDSAASELRQLDKAGSANTHRPEVERATAVLARYVDQMRSFIQVTAANDSAVADMGLHASTLMALTDRARERQHAANVDSLGSLTEADQRLRDSRDVVDSAHELREAMLDLQRAEAQHVAALGFGVGLFGSGRPLTLADFHIAIDRLIGTADRLQSALDRTDPLVDRYPAKQSAARYAATVDGLQAAVTELRAAQAERDAALSRFEAAVQAAAGLGGDDAERPAISSPLGERMLAEQIIRTLPVVRALVLTGTLNRQPDVTFLSSMLPSLRVPLDGLYRVQARAAAAQQALEAAQRAGADAASAIEALTARILMVKATGYTAIQDEVVQLIAYAIQANDTEQETQNVAVVALRLGRRAADAVAVRDAEEADRIVADAGALLETVRGLPMSPLLQDEVLSAIRNWRDSLRRTAEGLRRLNQLLITMDRDAGALVETARQLDETFRDEAARIGELLTRILVIGATIARPACWLRRCGGGGAVDQPAGAAPAKADDPAGRGPAGRPHRRHAPPGRIRCDGACRCLLHPRDRPARTGCPAGEGPRRPRPGRPAPHPGRPDPGRKDGVAGWPGCRCGARDQHAAGQRADGSHPSGGPAGDPGAAGEREQSAPQRLRRVPGDGGRDRPAAGAEPSAGLRAGAELQAGRRRPDQRRGTAFPAEALSGGSGDQPQPVLAPCGTQPAGGLFRDHRDRRLSRRPGADPDQSRDELHHSRLS